MSKLDKCQENCFHLHYCHQCIHRSGVSIRKTWGYRLESKSKQRESRRIKRIWMGFFQQCSYGIELGA